MSVATIQIPTTQIETIRESLAAARHDLAGQLSRPGGDAAGGAAHLDEIDDLIGQIDSLDPGAGESHGVSGSRQALWAAAYDAACRAAERIADDCNDYWRGAIAAADVKREIAELGERFDLLEALGPPVGEGEPG